MANPLRCVVLVGVLLMLALVVARGEREEALREERGRLLRDRGLEALRRLEGGIASLRRDLEGLSNSPVVREAMAEGDGRGAWLAQLAGGFAGGRHIAGFVLVDADGRPWFTDRDEAPDFGSVSLVSNLLASGIAPPEFDPSGPYLLLGQAIEEEHAIRGGVVIRCDLGGMLATLLPGGEGFEYAVVSGDRTLFASPTPDGERGDWREIAAPAGLDTLEALGIRLRLRGTPEGQGEAIPAGIVDLLLLGLALGSMMLLLARRAAVERGAASAALAEMEAGQQRVVGQLEQARAANRDLLVAMEAMRVPVAVTPEPEPEPVLETVVQEDRREEGIPLAALLAAGRSRLLESRAELTALESACRSWREVAERVGALDPGGPSAKIGVAGRGKTGKKEARRLLEEAARELEAMAMAVCRAVPASAFPALAPRPESDPHTRWCQEVEERLGGEEAMMTWERRLEESNGTS
ncbi:MAG: cache domain-containing protein [Magnetococcales bacterium]|nr:cache domain-containing protein [Magnetococcales bacterium]